MFRLLIICFLFQLRYFIPIPSSLSCPKGSVQNPMINNTCYAYEKTKNQAYAAEKLCQKYKNGHAASISDAYENKFIQDYLAKMTGNSSDAVWLGATPHYYDHCNWSGCYGEYYWRWNDNSIFSFTNFDPSLGSDAEINTCIAMIPKTGYWTKPNITDSYAVICKFYV